MRLQHTLEKPAAAADTFPNRSETAARAAIRASLPEGRGCLGARYFSAGGILRPREERKRVKMRFAPLKTITGSERPRPRGRFGARDECLLAALVQKTEADGPATPAATVAIPLARATSVRSVRVTGPIWR